MKDYEKAQDELIEFLVGNKTRKVEAIAAFRDKIYEKQKIIYDKDPKNQEIIDLLCDVSDLIDLCTEFVVNAL